MDRQQILRRVVEAPQISVLIIGAGINGISTFHDLALQGVSILLVDRADFCSGASAASSHMAHGGIRYLENGEFRLVREAVQERNRLLRNAPHYVKPLPTIIPIFKRFSGLLNAPFKFLGWLNKPAERGALVIKIGLMIYDAFTGKQRDVPRHRFLSRSGSLAEFPRLNPEIINTACYYDGLIQMPERLCIEMITDTLTASPSAHALNYVSVSGSAPGVVRLTDELSGETFTVNPQVVINAAGPWIDLANERLGQRTRFIGGTKGSHIVVKHDALHEAIGDNEFFFENDDGRIVLLCPLFDRVIIGTSDIRIDNPDEVDCTDEEIGYFLQMVKKVFPDIKVDRSQIVFAFSGVRPLPAAAASTTGQISRDHSIQHSQWDGYPILSLVGGKWTTQRAFGEQVTDQVLKLLGQPRKQSTEDLPIGGGRDYQAIADALPIWAHKVAAKTGLPAERISELFDRYGSQADDIAAAMSKLGKDAVLKGASGYSRNEVLVIVNSEQVNHIDDFLLRRSNLAIRGLVSKGLIEELSTIMAGALGWSKAEAKAEVKRAADLLTTKHGMSL